MDNAANCKVAGEEGQEFIIVENTVLARWEKMTIPLHCLGFALTLRFYDKTYLSTKAPSGILIKALNLDKEVIVGVIEAFKRTLENNEETQMLQA
ncbi:hypothetical protein CTI12_AA163000 [Artemisia annua]|uniref:Uncharacterized protein n=1 Tax=Artemisia annua TaxID=35608 RepID=A0A2U1PE34_ARTAN|nr:hypothetical protein CTI12_AA163000 [Artemisia annua]